MLCFGLAFFLCANFSRSENSCSLSSRKISWVHFLIILCSLLFLSGIPIRYLTWIDLLCMLSFLFTNHLYLLFYILLYGCLIIIINLIVVIILSPGMFSDQRWQKPLKKNWCHHFGWWWQQDCKPTGVLTDMTLASLEKLHTRTWKSQSV